MEESFAVRRQGVARFYRRMAAMQAIGEFLWKKLA
jgi:hypothetical protein